MPIPPTRSLKLQLAAALGLLFALLIAAIGYTSYELNLRRNDYRLQNSAHHLQTLSHALVEQSQRYLMHRPDDYEKYGRDLTLYYPLLHRQLEQYEQIVQGFLACNDPTATDTALAPGCALDRRSSDDLTHLAATWKSFRGGLRQTLGMDEDGPRLTAAAEFVAANGREIDQAAMQFAASLQAMMEARLERVRIFLWAVGMVALAAFLFLLYALVVRVLRPLSSAQEGFARVAQGDFSHPVPVEIRNEIGDLVAAFNALAERLAAMFRFAARINRGTTLEQTLQFVREEFQRFVPVDWIGVLTPAAAEPERWQLERYAAAPGLGAFDATVGLRIGDCPAGLLEACHPLACDPARLAGLPAALAAAGLRSFALAPLPHSKQGGGMLAFAAFAAEAYDENRLEFIGNISGQVSPVLDRTLVLEGLVVAAVSGLAKLAESRDPETGDHLLRMARYSALIAEELGRTERYRERIDPAYVRDILRFAPMHDIGKVGIADSILLKPGRLDADEFAAMQRHPLIGGEVLRRCEAQVNELGYRIFTVAIEIAEGHHEKFDGSGYPRGLAGEGIPLAARIIAVADVFDALTSRRPYKEAWPVMQALETLRRESGKHFDPEVVTAFERVLPQVMLIYETHKHV